MSLQSAKSAVAQYLSDSHQWRMTLAGTGAVAQLERKFAALVGHPHALAVTNATSGLWAVLTALQIHDAEVITTPYTWGGSLVGLLLTRNRPVFADIDNQTLTLDPDAVVKQITAKTKAILAVDIHGHPCHGIALRQVADEYGLALIQDCAQSFGAYRQNRHTGWWADAAVFSLTVGKALFAGEGGVVVTPDATLLDQLVWHTQHPERQRRDVPFLPTNEFAFNARVHPLAAIWANATFETSLRRLEAHQRWCFRLIQSLHEIGLTVPIGFKPPQIVPSFLKLTTLWQDNPQPETLIRELDGRGFSVALEPSPVRLLYEQPEFLARYGHDGVVECPNAAHQARHRFCLVNRQDKSYRKPR